jgi:hypothetical protein
MNASKETCCNGCQISNFAVNNEHYSQKQGRHQKVLYTMWHVLWSKEQPEMGNI